MNISDEPFLSVKGDCFGNILRCRDKKKLDRK
jgi:hypothetical protein